MAGQDDLHTCLSTDDQANLQELFGFNKLDFLETSYKFECDVLEKVVEQIKDTLLKEHPESEEAIQSGCEQLSADLEVHSQISFAEWYKWCSSVVFSVHSCIPVSGMHLRVGEIGDMQTAQMKSEMDALDSQIKSACTTAKGLQRKVDDVDKLMQEHEDTLKVIARAKEKHAVFKEIATKCQAQISTMLASGTSK